MERDIEMCSYAKTVYKEKPHIWPMLAQQVKLKILAALDSKDCKMIILYDYVN